MDVGTAGIRVFAEALACTPKKQLASAMLLDASLVPDVLLSGAVRVAVRVRPAVADDVEDGAFHSCVAVDAPRVFITTNDQPVIMHDSKPDGVAEQAGLHRFTFESVFPQDRPTTAVYREFCIPCIQAVASGTNATIMAYGQTGTGKTHTMCGTPEQPGVMLLAARDLCAQQVRPLRFPREQGRLAQTGCAAHLVRPTPCLVSGVQGAVPAHEHGAGLPGSHHRPAGDRCRRPHGAAEISGGGGTARRRER